MRNLYSCPNCQSDLKTRKPGIYPRKWYRVVSKNTLKCPCCGAEIEKRFENFDLGLAMISTTGGLVSLWGAGKIVLPILIVTVSVRYLIGKFATRYVMVER